MRRASTIAVLCTLWLAPAGARAGTLATAQLVRDLRPGSASYFAGYLSWLTPLRGEVLYAADDGFLGVELWASDGTAAGTRLVADTCSGFCSGAPRQLVTSGDLVYFFALDRFYALSLWRSDGTADGTFPLLRVDYNGFGESFPESYLSRFGASGVVFVRFDRVRGVYELWRSDGSVDGTSMVAPLPRVREPGFDLARLPNQEPDQGMHLFAWAGYLWQTDGTPAGTHRANPGVDWCGGVFRMPQGIVIGGSDEGHGCEPFLWSGKRSDARLIADLQPGAESGGPSVVARVGDTVYLHAEHGSSRLLWASDLTARGTRLVRDARRRAIPGQYPSVAADGRLFFVRAEPGKAAGLWATYSADRAAPVPGLGPDVGVLGLAPSVDGAYVVSGAAPGTRLWHTRGTAASTTLLAEVAAAQELIEIDGRLFFVAHPAPESPALWKSDGTAASTQAVAPPLRPAASSINLALHPAPRGVLLEEGYGWLEQRLLRTDGTRAGTAGFAESLFDPRSFPLRFGSGFGGLLVSGVSEGKVAWTDGAEVRPLLDDPQERPLGVFADLGERAVFLSGEASGSDETIRLWSTDGTRDATAPILTVDAPGLAYSERAAMSVAPQAGEAVFLVQYAPYFVEGQSPLMVTDGTASGTRALATLPQRASSYVRRIVTAGRTVYVEFSGDVAKLWAVEPGDPTPRLVFDGGRPWRSGYLEELTPFGDRLVFVGGDEVSGTELRVSDGSVAGTRPLIDIAPGAASSSPANLVVLGDRIFFSADDGSHGRELWVTDGTPEGTRSIELRAGPRGSDPQSLRVVEGNVVFAADDGVHGLEPWVTDGTAAGTHLLADVVPGPVGSTPSQFAPFESWLLFSAGRPSTGYELYRIPLAAVTAPPN